MYLSANTTRYQYDNHLGSTSLELDEKAEIISYEEYHPFGTTSYRSGRNETEVSLKRYKYVGKERDNETGLYYYGARYYAGWLGRWASVDPMAHLRSWVSPYNYVQNNPVNKIDPDGALDTKYEDENGNVLLNTHDESDAVVIVTDEKRKGFDAAVKGTKNTDDVDWNNTMKKSLLGFELSEKQENLLISLNSDWSRKNAIAYWQNPTAENVISFAFSEALSQWTNPYLVVGGLSAGISTFKPIQKVNIFLPEYPEVPAVPGTRVPRTLYPDETFDRYGDLFGRWAAPVGTDYSVRSIPEGLTSYTKFQIVKSLKVEQSLSNPGYLPGQKGYGIQYKFSKPIKEYIPEYIKIISNEK